MSVEQPTDGPAVGEVADWFIDTARTYYRRTDGIVLGVSAIPCRSYGVPSLEADFDGGSDIDGADYLIWQVHAGASSDLEDWQTGYGDPFSRLAVAHPLAHGPVTHAVPEPGTFALAVSSLSVFVFVRRNRPVTSDT